MSATDPKQTIASEWRAITKCAENLPRPRGEGRLDEVRVRLNGRSISVGVLQHHDQAHGPLMALDEIRPLAAVAPILGLEVEDHPIDLRIDDLCGPEKCDVTGLAMISGRDLQRGLPRWIGNSAHELGDGQLSSVTERVSTPRICAHHNVQADGFAHGAERCDADAGVAFLNSPLGVGGNAGPPAGLGPCQPMLAARHLDLAADRLALRVCSALTQPSSCGSFGDRHQLIIAIAAYLRLTR